MSSVDTKIVSMLATQPMRNTHNTVAYRLEWYKNVNIRQLAKYTIGN